MPGFPKVELLASEECSGSLDEWMTEGLVKAQIKNGRLYFESAADSSAVIIVDNKSPDFRSVGSWNPSTRDKGFGGENYLWCAKGDGSAHADFTPTLPVDGVYKVYVK